MNSTTEELPKPIHVVIIGGGATGTGIAREAAGRGYRVTLIERGELGSGTSGHFHGMLHSGARYVVNDPSVAADCYAENQRLRSLIPSAITDTGGMFVALSDEEAAHADVILAACQKAGIPTKEITITEALRLEPHLSHQVQRAFLAPDGCIDGAEVIRCNKKTAESSATPATFLEQHSVVEFIRMNGGISKVVVKDAATDKTHEIQCDFVINAAGVWAGQVAELAGAPFDMVFDKGTMIQFKRRFSNRILNRCRPEADGDLLVTSPARSIMGTTSRTISDPDDCLPTQEEVDALMDEGTLLVPQLRHAEVERVYAGVRPLLKTGDLDGNSRAISRSFRVLDHEADGINNFISVIGGKVTLFRRMAEDTVKLLDEKTA